MHRLALQIKAVHTARAQIRWPVPVRHVRSQHNSSSSSSLPRIMQPSFWDSVIPKAWRNRGENLTSVPENTKRKKSINPATYFIWISILIGSQSIRLIGIQTEFNTFIRKAELKIGKLREVIEKLQRGEEVDVEKALGTGDEAQERDWEEALEEIKNEEMLWQINKKKNKEERARRTAEQQDASPVNDTQDKTSPDFGTINFPLPNQSAPRFY